MLLTPGTEMMMNDFFRTLELKTIHDLRGCLTVFENLSAAFLPKIERIYFIYNVSEDAERGAHAHKALTQLMIPISGSFVVDLEKNHYKESILLNNPSRALLIEPGTWRNLRNFSPSAVCLVLASNFYEEADYIRDYNEFIRMTNEKFW